MLALLALAGLPALAQAGPCDSSEIQYGPCGVIPESGVKPKHPKSGGGGEHESTPGKPAAGGGEAESPATGTESEGQGKHAGGPGAAGEGGGKGPGGAAAGQRATIGLADERALSAGPAPAAAADEGGSSPLVPVLIAVAVLAAVSIGTVIYRQRRQFPVH